MPTSSSVTFYRYFPETLDKETLQYLLVGRQKLLDSLLKEVDQASQSGTPRFFLLVGPRGIGKSHLMTLLYHRVSDELSEQMIPVKLAEEEYSIFRASDFFLRLLEEMKIGISDVIALEEDRLIRDVAVDKLKEVASAEGKQIAIFVENLHELFKQMDKREIQALRSIFQQTNVFSVFASAPLIFPDVSDHDEPFYNFFQIFHLQELKRAEVKELMKRVARVDGNTAFIENFQDYEPKIEGLSHLIGGSPRLVVLFYEIISRGEIDDVEKIFFKMMDEHTPYYQEIFQMLTGQRRIIFDTILNSETPLTPKNIAKRSRLDAATVNAQLRRLEMDGYVISHPMKKRTSYEVRERLFRLWRAMRKPLGRDRIFIFIEFLKTWYSPDERAAAFEMKLRELESGNKNVLKELCYYAESLTPEYGAKYIPELSNILSELGELDEASYFSKKFNGVTKSVDKDAREEFLSKGEELLMKNQDSEAILCFERALAINPRNEMAYTGKGLAQLKLAMYDEAIESFTSALKINNKNHFGLLGKGLALQNLGNFEEALEAYNENIEFHPNDELTYIHELTYICKGNLLETMDRNKEALESYNRALEINPLNTTGLFAEGSLFLKMEEYEEALKCFNKGLEVNPDNVRLLVKIGSILAIREEYEVALQMLDKALNIDPKDGYAIIDKCKLLLCLGKCEELFEFVKNTSNNYPEDADILALVGCILTVTGRTDEGLEYIQKSLDISPESQFTHNVLPIIASKFRNSASAITIIHKALKYSRDKNVQNQLKLALINSYIIAGKRNDALMEIEIIEGQLADVDQLTQFMHLCLTLAREELLEGNQTNGLRLIKIAYTQADRLEPSLVKKITIDFLKKIIEEGQVSVIKSAVNEIIIFKGTEFQWFLKPVANAIEIIETKDTKLYYTKLQSEEREVVADIVQKITKSDELLPKL